VSEKILEKYYMYIPVKYSLIVQPVISKKNVNRRTEYSLLLSLCEKGS
jgi:hypothetical protein